MKKTTYLAKSPKLTFLPQLDASQIFHTQKITHDIWADGHTFEERLQTLTKLLDFPPKNMLSMCGFIDTNNNLVCSLKRYFFDLKIQGQKTPCLGLGALYTPPEFRGHGYARKLMTTVLDEARQTGIKAALGFSDIDTTFYQSLGFIPLHAENIIIAVENLPSLTPAFAIKKAASDDVPHLISYFDRIFPENCVRPLRDSLSWRFFRERNGPQEDLLLSENGQELGYVSISTGPGIFFLNEFYVESPYEERLLALLKDLALAHGVKEIHGCKPFQALTGVPKKLETRSLEIPIILSLDSEISLTGVQHNSWFGYLDQF